MTAFLRRVLAKSSGRFRALEPSTLASSSSSSSTFSSTSSSSSSSSSLSPSPVPSPSSSRPGLFGLPGLHSPADWARLADDCVAESDRLAAAAAAAPPTAAAVRALDDLSDAVCRVADAAELCRVAAAGAEWRASAAAAAARLGAHVYGLNAHAGMASALAAAMRAEEDRQRRNDREQPGSSDAHSSSFSREASRVGGALLRDFSRSGMFLPTAAARRAASEAEAAAAQASVRFTDALADPEAGGIRFDVSYSNSPVAATPAAVAAALRFEPDAGLRRRCYEAAFSTKTTGHLTRPLHAMLEARARRAEALGFGEKGWRGMLIDDDDDADDDEINESGSGKRGGGKRGGGKRLLEASLAGSASTVRSFLLDLAGELRPLAEEQVSQLSRAKKRSVGSGSSVGEESLQPWDVSFFSARVRAEAAAAAAATASGGLLSSASPAPASPQVPVEDAVGGMLDVLEAAVGVRLVRAPLGEGEGWAPGVAKFVAVDVGDGGGGETKKKKAAAETSSSSSLDRIDASRVLGDVYLDLAPRPAKFPGAAHFTLRCGRSNSFLGSDGGVREERNNGKALAASRPAVAIVASFSGLRERREENSINGGAVSSSSPLPPLPWLGSMAWAETSTLLHEGGHALHSLLSRTEFQHLSGTRGPLDVVELPSHVAERWARLPAGGGAGGAGDGGHASAGAAAAALATRGRVSRLDFVAAEAARRATAALDFLGQVTDALVDQELHRGGGGEGPGGGGERFSAEAAAADAAALVAAVSPLPQPPPPSSSPSLSSFSPHARFGHLAGYGGAYYSYVYAECVAADVCARSRGLRSSPEDAGTGGGQKRDLDLLTRRALRAGGEALRESLLRHGCSAPPREAVRELLERSSGGVVVGGEKKAEGGGGSSRGGGGWRPDPTARLAEVEVL